MRFDLGASTTIGSIAVAWHQGDTRVQTFAVQVSADAACWRR
ncbi:hypothetical protein ACQSSU_17960 [Micromonospora echinospora]